MRSAIFFGLVLIANAIAAQTGYELSDTDVVVGGIIFILVFIADIIDLFFRLK